MSTEHEHHHPPQLPETRDAGSQALAEALHSSFIIVKIAMFALVVLIFSAGFFTVGPQERAVVLRFGKPMGEGQKMLLTAGLHWSLPYPIDEVVRIPVTELQHVTSTAGWYFTTPEMEASGFEPPPGASLNPAVDGSVITADRNIIHVRVTVPYHIEDPLRAIFNFASGTNQEFNLNGVSNAVLQVANNAIIATAARFNVDDILVRNRASFAHAVDQYIRVLVDRENLGVALDNECTVEPVAPRQLKEVFAAVSTALQNHDKLINVALGDTNRILSEAAGRAASITNVASSSRNRYVADMRSQSAAFQQLLNSPEYKRNPRLYEEMKLAEAMAQVLTNVQDKIFLPQREDGQARELRLQLNREPPQPKTAANP